MLYLEARIEGRSSRWPLGAAVVHAGRDPSCDIVIDDPSVSGRHLKLEVRDRVLHVEDLGSRNGLWLAGQRVTAATVRPDGWFVAGCVPLALREGISLATAPDGPAPRATAARRTGEQTVPVAGFDTHSPAEMPEFVFASDTGRHLLEEADRLAVSPLAVLLVGETGTGKELLARRIHARSPRHAGPFVAISCSALPGERLEAELFGVATGSGERTGGLVQASGGTILLDEIGDLPPALQARLLCALEAGEVLPAGAPHAVKIDVRIVSATHRDLHAEADGGTFRRDLLYRIAGAVVRVPPLRERPEDVLPLARAFARQAAAAQGHPFRGIDLEAARLLAGYAWPGNVRELRRAIARAVALADSPVLHSDLLPPEIAGRGNAAVGGMLLGLEGGWREARRYFDRIYFVRLLERCGGNLTEAARLAGLARSNLYRRLQELQLHRRDAPGSPATSRGSEAGRPRAGGTGP